MAGKRGFAIFGGVVIVAALAVGAVYAFTPDRDPVFDDDKAFVALLASTAVTVPPDVALPEASGTVALKPTDPVVVVSKEALRFPLSDLRIELQTDKTHGVEAKYKRDGADGLYVTPLGEVLKWAKGKDGQARTARGDDPTASTLTVLADRTTPYRLLLEILYTATEVEFRHVAFAVRRGDQLSAFDTPPTRRETAVRPTKPRLLLTVQIVPEGFAVKANAGSLAPGCKEAGPGLAVGKGSDGSYDFAALRQCAVDVKGASVDFADEGTFAVSAGPEVSYEVLVKTIEAVRKTADGKDLFPEFGFAVAK